MHDVANQFWLSGKERIIRQRTLVTLRIYDAYVTSSLGLPRNLRVNDTTGDGIPTDAPFIASPEMLTAANANVELLEIMSNTRESVFFTDTTTPGQTSQVISTARLQSLSMALDRWALKYRVFTNAADDASKTSTK